MIADEKRIVARMIWVYCKGRHKNKGGLCADCEALRDYALSRLEKCPFGDDKSSCRKCRIHCYRDSEREKIREVMRYAGPRMILYYPLETLLHLLSVK